MQTDATAHAWPELATPGWQDTSRTLLLWSQIIGKTRLALAPMTNHWWQVTLYVSARGLTTSPIPCGSGIFEVELDFIAHRLNVRKSDGTAASLPLEAVSVAEFYAGYFGALRGLGIDVKIYPLAVEIQETIRLDQDRTPRPYDRDWARRFFVALSNADRVLKQFRGRFLGKSSPVHFFWGASDLAVTRFSGRSAPPHPGGIPHCPDRVSLEAYSHEVSSAGFWPGDVRFPEAAFYSYAYPEPPGFSEAPLRPSSARYDQDVREFVLPYAAVRQAADPDAEVLSFLESTYAAAAELAHWDRAALEQRTSGARP
jgi:hypothetical protein